MMRHSLNALPLALAGLLFCAAAFPAATHAQPPSTLIPFQGELSNGGGERLTGNFALLFAIYDAPTAGTPLWSEVHRGVSVNAGRVNVILGNQSPIGDLPFGAQTLFLGITVGNSPSDLDSNQELIPRHQLIPSFHAITASETASVRDAAITTSKIASGAVSSEKIAANAVTPDKVRNATIERRHLSTAVAQSTVPVGAIVLWDQSNTCPAGYSEAREFINLTIRGADTVGGNPELPDNAGVSCSTLGCQGGGAAARFDDRLQVEELARHNHTYDVPGGNTGSVPIEVRSRPAVPRPTSFTGNDANHYHPLRTVLFCRKN